MMNCIYPSGGVCEDPTKLFGFDASFASGMDVSWTAGKLTGDEKPAIEKTFAVSLFFPLPRDSDFLFFLVHPLFLLS